MKFQNINLHLVIGLYLNIKYKIKNKGVFDMYDLTLINKKVCETLKTENNEMTYKAWLFFTENAQLIEDNIVLLVPNQFVKNVIEERYLFQIEELYRGEFEFNQFIIKVNGEEAVKAVEDNSEKICFGEQFASKLEDFVEAINTHVKNIYDFIETASKNGNSFVSYTLINESFCGEEIYWRIKEFMINKGFKVELSTMDSSCTLSLSW